MPFAFIFILLTYLVMLAQGKRKKKKNCVCRKGRMRLGMQSKMAACFGSLTRRVERTCRSNEGRKQREEEAAVIIHHPYDIASQQRSHGLALSFSHSVRASHRL